MTINKCRLSFSIVAVNTLEDTMEPLDLLIAEAIRDNVQKLRKLRASGSSVADGETATHDIELLVGLQ